MIRRMVKYSLLFNEKFKKPFFKALARIDGIDRGIRKMIKIILPAIENDLPGLIIQKRQRIVRHHCPMQCGA
jgi:hypothetical protein